MATATLAKAPKEVIFEWEGKDRNGKVVGVAYVHDDDELMLISQQGMILRMKAGDIRTIGRATQGVRLIEMEDGDNVVSVAKLAEKDDDPDAPAPPGEPAADPDAPAGQ